MNIILSLERFYQKRKIFQHNFREQTNNNFEKCGEGENMKKTIIYLTLSNQNLIEVGKSYKVKIFCNKVIIKRTIIVPIIIPT